MTIPLLSTKLYLAPPRPNLVPRPHLLDRMDEGLRQGSRLTLVSAPAGYGKSMLAAAWLHKLSAAGLPAARVSWLSLDENDNDPVRFLAYLVAALQGLGENIGRSTQNLLAGPQLPPIEMLMTGLVNDLAAPQPLPAMHAVPEGNPGVGLVLALDDYHKIRLPSIHEAVQFLLDHSPPQFHLILIAREDPPLSLPKFRVRGEMTEIRAQDLRFTVEETGQFFHQALKFDLADEWVQSLEARTEGWIAGLQLAALSLQARDDMAAFLEDFRGSHRYVIDYLMDEVLRIQTAEIRQFLYQTSILDRFNASLSAAVTGREDTHEILSQLEQSNLFLVPLDERREWYRYHHMFGDFLRTELEDQQQALLHQQAAAWFEANGLIPEAVQHALRTGDSNQAADLIERAMMVPTTWSGGQVSLIESWLKALPEASVRSRPQLAIRASRALFLAGKLDHSERLLEQAEQALRANPVMAPDTAGALSMVTAYRAAISAMHGEITQARSLVAQSIDGLPEEDALTKARLTDTLGLIHELSGNMADAEIAYLRASDSARATGVLYLAINARCEAALVQIIQGQLSQAAQTCQQALQLAETGSEQIPPTGLAWSILGEIARQHNNLTVAGQFISAGIELSLQGGIIDDLRYEFIFLAQLKQAQGDQAAASAAMQQASRILQAYNLPRLSALSLANWARLHLAQGKLDQASLWANEYEIQRSAEPVEYLREFEDLTLARVWLAEARHTEARVLLAALISLARSTGRIGTVIEAQLLLAQAAWAQGEKSIALDALSETLSLAEPQGYVRIFVDQGEAMRVLLEQLQDGIEGSLQIENKPLQAYAQRLLSVFGHASSPRSRALTSNQPSKNLDLIEPLSEQELRVLRLLSAGLSNQEIATELVIGLGTVKWHVHNLYGKLGVNSRTQAIAKGQELKIL